MSAAPPVPNLLVVRSPDTDRAVRFYRAMGLVFERHSHGIGPEHYAAVVCGFVFEIYPQRNADEGTLSVRLGFSVDDVDGVVEMLRNAGAVVVMPPKDSEWGRRAVVKDLDGHTVELLTPPDRDRAVSDFNNATQHSTNT